MLAYRFEFRPYQRSFKRPLSTHHGIWEVREGIILRLTDEMGRMGWGEIAPIPWFGSETLEQALEFCQQLPPKITATDIFSIPTEYPACQFGFESAWEWGHGDNSQFPSGALPTREMNSRVQRHPIPNSQFPIPNSQFPIPFSYLLPTGEAALQSWQTPWNQGSRTFKWKIGVAAIEEELQVFNQLIQALPPSAKLRLDANGGLSWQDANQWFKIADEVGRVEFLEQPLPPEQFDAMLEMSTRYSTPIALDESVATLNQMEDCYQRGWRGIFVIKAAIAGSPKRLRQFCQQHNIDAVFSSVFETAIAKQSVLQLATELSNPNRAVGFGVNQWFNEDEASVYSLLP
ncbi:MAG: o-succinylbenzoate synthase [Coleofasciculaceae cyanobacterium]